MTRKFLISLVLFAIFLSACGPKPASDTSLEQTPGSTHSAESEATGFPGAEAGTATPAAVGGLGRGSFLFDLPVQNSDGDSIAVIDDAVINLQTQSVDYLVLSLGADGRTVIIPWAAVNPNMIMDLPEDETSYRFSLATEQGTLESSPDFQLSEIPAFGDTTTDWDAQWRVYWEMGSAAPAAETATPTVMAGETATPDPSGAGTPIRSAPLSGVVLLSQLIGMSVQTSDGQSAGAVEEVLINSSGAAAFVVLATTDADGEASIVAVPLHLLGWSEGFGGLVLNVNKAMLDAAPNFAGGEYPTNEAGGWDAEVSTYWAAY